MNKIDWKTRLKQHMGLLASICLLSGCDPQSSASSERLTQTTNNASECTEDNDCRSNEGAKLIGASSSDRSTEGARDPAGDAEMIQAIIDAAPKQHPTEARFVKIEGSEIDVLVRCDEFAFGKYIGCEKSYNAFIDWTGGAWNWKDWEMVQPAGGGHADYGGNEVYLAELKLSLESRLVVDWSRPIDPQPLNDKDCGAPVSGPVASHTYATPLFIEKNDEYWHHTTGGWPATKKCKAQGQKLSPGMGGWTYNKSDWTKRDSLRLDYGRACYHRKRNMIYLFQQANGGDIAEFDASNEYAVTIKNRQQWFSGAGYFDAAMDQARDICYYYHNQTGIDGIYYDPETGKSRKVFTSKDKTMDVYSLSVEHSTGNLVIVGVKGHAIHIDTDTGKSMNISAKDGSGIPDTTAAGKEIFGKFDMIEKIPCIGIGMADARKGVYLMTLPASVCSMENRSTEEILAASKPSPIGSTGFLERCKKPGVVFCDPLSTKGPYGKDSSGDLVVLKNPDGSEGVPGDTWWRQWRGVQSFANGRASAAYDPELDALKLVMPPNFAASGLFTTNFSKDLKTQFSEGDTFRLEFQFRYNCEFIYEDCNPASPNFKTDRRPIVHEGGSLQGAKLAIIGEGDNKPGESANACVVIQIVPYGNTGHTLAAFRNCGKYMAIQKGSAKKIQGSAQSDWQAGGDFSCLRFPDNKTNKYANWKKGGTGPNCAYLEPDEWMTFAMEVTIGRWQKKWTGKRESQVKFFLGREGQPLKKVIDLPTYLSPPDSRYRGYGKIWLQIHSTKAKKGTDRPENIAWYRNLIVSTL